MLFRVFRVCSGYPEQLKALTGKDFFRLFRVFRATPAPVRARAQAQACACVCTRTRLLYPEHPEQKQIT